MIYLDAIKNKIGSAKFYYEYFQSTIKANGDKKAAKALLEDFLKKQDTKSQKTFWVRLASESILNEDSIRYIEETTREGKL
jgi:hypothetical protein